MALYFIEFVILSLAGWVYECTYCTIRTGRWQNRGFLYGPICPIYGAGAVTALLLCHHLPKVLNPSAPIWRIFLLSALGSAVLELTTSITLEKLFHARWWDYSYLPLNFQGRICVPAATLFGLMGIAIVKLLLPFETQLAAQSVPLLNEAVSLVLAFAVGIDTGLTVDGLMKLGARLDAMQKEFDESMESGVERIKSAPAALAASAKAREQALTALVQDNLKALSARQRYLLNNMSFRGAGRDMGELLQDAVTGVRRRLEVLRTVYTKEEYDFIHNHSDNPGN